MTRSKNRANSCDRFRPRDLSSATSCGPYGVFERDPPDSRTRPLTPDATRVTSVRSSAKTTMTARSRSIQTPAILLMVLISLSAVFDKSTR